AVRVDQVVAPADRELAGQHGDEDQHRADDTAAPGHGQRRHEQRHRGRRPGMTRAQKSHGPYDAIVSAEYAVSSGTSTVREPSPRDPRIVAVHGVLPPYRYRQSEITEAFATVCLPDGADRAVLERLHRNAQVRTRHFALPLEEYAALQGFGDSNDRFIEAAVEYGGQAVKGALEHAGLRPSDVD